MLRIGIVDDHKLFRKSLTLLVDSFEGMEVVLDAENGKDFFKKLKNQPIDVVLLDIQMPIMDGFETCSLLLKKHPLVKILVVSQLTTKQSIHRIMDIGAHGYFTKNTDPEQLDLAIKSLDDKGYYFSIELGTVMREVLIRDKKKVKKTDIDYDVENAVITPRELQIIVLICKEYSSKEIGEKLFIDKRSVESHRTNIMRKTNSTNIIGIVLFALRRGLVSLDQF
jgi:two-component system, NarL family, response regulator DegU